MVALYFYNAVFQNIKGCSIPPPLVSHHNPAMSAVFVELLVVLRRICTRVETPLSRGILLIKCNVPVSML